MNQLMYGVAYYDEYMPYDRLDKDIEMMKAAGINVVRIAESTWSTLEPQSGVFDFSHIDRVLTGMHGAEIKVIVGTPTYAVPTWLVKEHPSVLAMTPQGQNKYGPRQNMDITDPAYLFHAERVIRKLIAHVKDHPAVIGYQADNETKHYHTSGENVQLQFVKYLKDKFCSLEELNQCFGLDYWSNRINSWEDFPSTDATINASLGGEFAKFQRKLVTDFLSWQVSIINEYKRQDQFVTQNFDFEWRGYSYGVQPDVNHFEASKAFDIVGVDIYHPSQQQLTGYEISFCGDVARSLKGKNYLVMETQAQGFAQWVPFPGQLRLQAFSHVASGANMVAYWHWHSIHNSFETYWKGLLSHDFEANPTYEEAQSIGRDFARFGQRLVNLKKTNKVALLVSNESLTALNSFRYVTGDFQYNDYVRLMYDALYRMNIGCDVIDPGCDHMEEYSMLAVPPLYSASDELLNRLNRFVEGGGHVIYGFRSGFSDENVKVRTVLQPGIISEACGVGYSQFTVPDKTKLASELFDISEDGCKLTHWIELLQAPADRILFSYEHPHWGKYAAVTHSSYGYGTATYIGCVPTGEVMEKLIEWVFKKAGLWDAEQQLHFPVITKVGVNDFGRTIRCYFNYSDNKVSVPHRFQEGVELVSGRKVGFDDQLELDPWGFMVIETQESDGI